MSIFNKKDQDFVTYLDTVSQLLDFGISKYILDRKDYNPDDDDVLVSNQFASISHRTFFDGSHALIFARPIRKVTNSNGVYDQFLIGLAFTAKYTTLVELRTLIYDFGSKSDSPWNQH
jgi:hypothetical protein